jgi:redox-sensing transcriptional repressor
MNKDKFPLPTLERLCSVYHILEQMEADGIEKVSSISLGSHLNVKPESVRKDISHFGEIGNCRAGYDVKKLREHLSHGLHLDRQRTICIAGLGRLGSAILNYGSFGRRGFDIVAGFDSNINRLETIRTSVPLFPAHEIANVVRTKKIDMAIMAVPASAAKETAKRLIDGGILGIVNFSTVVILPEKNVFIRNIDITGELRILSVLHEM